jgi:hypothetical protein
MKIRSIAHVDKRENVHFLIAERGWYVYNATYAAIPTRAATSAGVALDRVGRPADTALEEAAALADVPEPLTAATLLPADADTLAVDDADADTDDWSSARSISGRKETYSCSVNVVNRSLDGRVPCSSHTRKGESCRVGLVVVLRGSSVFERKRSESDKVVWAWKSA